MNLHHGVQRVKKDHRDYSANRTFGGVIDLSQLPDSYNCDAGFRFPDQNAEGLPEACTGYAQSELCQDEDDQQYQPRYNYDKTLFLEGQPEGEPCDIRDSLETTMLWGVLPNSTPLHNAAIDFTNSADTEAAKYKRGAYFVVELNKGLDWFDSMRNMLYAARSWRGSISVATPWFSEWTGIAVPRSGVVYAPPNYTWTSGHNWKVSGWKTINGVPYLVAKTWQGSLVGDGGWLYFSREIINNVMKVYGSGAFMLIKADMHNPADVQLVKLNWFSYFRSYGRYLLSKI